MKKYWKLFIPIYGMYHALVVDMCDLAYNHTAIYFGSAAAQAVYLTAPLTYILFSSLL